MLVSMIIPVYNVEKYLRRCLISVAEQTYPDLEVILVNDGSPDDSQKIIDEFCQKNKNFICYITENHGLGGARNFGLSKAHGDYICFLDSDDYIKENFVEVMVKSAITYQSDIVVCNNVDVFEKENYQTVSKLIYKQNPTCLMNDKEILFNRICAWGKLYKTELFQGLGYEPRAWYEDMRLTPKLYFKAKKISYVEDALVYYSIREGSIMTSSNAERNLEIIDAFEDLHRFFIEKGCYNQIKNQIEFLMLDHILVSAVSRIVMEGAKKNREIIKKMKHYVYSYENICSNPYLSKMPMNRKAIYYCNRFGMYSFTMILLKLKSKMKSK